MTGGRLRPSHRLAEVDGLVFAELDLCLLLLLGRDEEGLEIDSDCADSYGRAAGLALPPLLDVSWRDLSLCLLLYASVIFRLSSSFRERSSMLSRFKPSKNPSS